MAARKNLQHPEIVRQRIRTTQLMKRLQAQAFGKLDLTQLQQRAIEILLRKTLPDLTAVTHSGSVEMVKPDELTDNVLAHIASTGSAGASEAPPSPKEPSELH
jgi:hypothetical protein